MELIFSGPRREAVILHRILKADGIDAVCMTGTNHPSGAVFVRAEDAKNRTAISRAIERMQRERGAEGEDTCRPPADELLGVPRGCPVHAAVYDPCRPAADTPRRRRRAPIRSCQDGPAHCNERQQPGQNLTGRSPSSPQSLGIELVTDVLTH